MEIAPSNMDLIYRDILEKMKTARFGKAPAKAFIAWTTYAFRPLSVDEIQNPIEMDINDKIDDVQRTISSSAGGLCAWTNKARSSSRTQRPASTSLARE